MIKTEKEYLEAKRRLAEEKKMIEAQLSKLKTAGLTDDQVKLAIDPLRSFMLQLKEEIHEYERLKRGDFDDLTNLYGIGRTLVALRIFKGIKQSELAAKLTVKESQVSRDESNEYHGASVEKIQKVLDALGVTLKTKVEYQFKDVV
jgi:DNA-binding Xre family transcriptional regulator